MNLSKISTTIREKAAVVNLSLGLLALPVITGCSPASEKSQSLHKDGIERTDDIERTKVLPQSSSPHIAPSYLDVCTKLHEKALPFSLSLDKEKMQEHIGADLQKDFVDILRYSYKCLLPAQTDTSLPPETRTALADLREKVYEVYRTAKAGRLTAESGNSGNKSAIDGNSEMVYALIAKLDTAIVQLTPAAPPATK